MKKSVKITLIVIAVIILVIILLLAGAWSMFGVMITAANTIQKQEDGLYSMEYEGDYGFDEFLAKGGASSDSEVAAYLTEYLSHGFYKAEPDLALGQFGCSTICTSDKDGNTLFGRNYDWEKCSGIIVHTKPEDGYESVSTCALDFLGFGEDYTPDGSMGERMMTLAAVYVPLDGMNEKGLMIADLIAGDDEVTNQGTDKADLTTTTAIRLLLDKAADVDEAVALLGQYDMNSSIGSAHHLFIADASGKSVAVEYIGGEMVVTDTNILTNHYLAQAKYGIGSEQSHKRFDTLTGYTDSTDMDGIRDMLKSVAQFNFPQDEGSYEKTMWSAVYSPSDLTVRFYFNENYEHYYTLTMGDNDKWIS